ncbi:MAG: hypothetical protein CL489_06650 [Acidobacteria bacterium]|nr:hypothetical protein [Acidobacteriota bacterium]
MKKVIELHVGLTSRHETMSRNDGKPIKSFIFGDGVENPLDWENHRKVAQEWIDAQEWQLFEPFNVEVIVYVTGLVALTTSFLYCWSKTKPTPFKLTLMHYNIKTGQYEAEKWA